ncbi:MAG: acetyl-CoA carboxylase carboxyltransferase subunit alpha [Pyrinomonadaceae bacterium]|nr:acetyl-CoA carboxylase carboxyltransferase subunit alpha [Pyrinomonadaceae bacterium]
MEVENEIAPYKRVQIARNQDRPYSLDLFNTMFEDFVEIHGDRRYSDDSAVICGFGKLDGIEVALIGQQKGRDMNQRRFRNFAMSKPEGYRKALRVMKIAEKFRRAIICFIDTPGAYPGIDAEERGQAEAIAYNLREMALLTVPVIVVVLGEGGSGGALAIGIGDRVLMLENAVYSVITPEGCAAILWKDAGKAELAANSLRLTAKELYNFGLVDEIIPESVEWSIDKEPSEEESSFDEVSDKLKKSILKHLRELVKFKEDDLITTRYEKFRKMGEWSN